MALRLSPHMTVMQNAAQKASRRLLRDFNEVEQLQVSIKGPSDFVSQADLRAEATLREELGKARPGYAFLMEESGAQRQRQLGLALDRRSARRHHQLPARRAAMVHLHRAGAAAAGRRNRDRGRDDLQSRA